MKINIGKLLGKVVAVVKANPEIALMVVGAVAPKAAAKVGRVIAVAAAAKAAGRVDGDGR